MKISTLHISCLMVLAAGCSTSQADTTQKALAIGGKQLTMQEPVKCASAQRPGRELAKYLSQYDPAQDPKEDIRDETPRTKKEIQLIKMDLVETGFQYPNGRESVITWMDFDADGACDFTASAGVGGMRSIDRMFLFRGLPKGSFQLADAYMTYMAGSSIVVPYIPMTVAGEKLPILVKRDTLMQWQPERKQVVTCETMAPAVQAGKPRPAPAALAALCPHAQQIYTWAAERQPHKNEVPHSNTAQ